MKIGFNISPLKNGHSNRGIGSYTVNLLVELKKNKSLEVFEFEDVNMLPKVDLVHYPYFDLFYPTLPLFKKYPTVVTIHDVTPLVFPKNYPKGMRGLINFNLQKLSIKNVRAVITDSFSSKKDIERYLNVPSSKISPIYLAIDDDFKKIPQNQLLEVKEKYNLPEQFALYVGGVNWNKNIVNIYKACKKANIKLVMIGSAFNNNQDLNHSEMQSYREFLEISKNDTSVLKIGYVDKKELIEIMNLAQVLVSASFYEGFGLPILEAQACGIPVITSNISSMPEIAGDGAVLVDPYSVEKIVLGINQAIQNKKSLINRGFKNLNKFSWQKTADETIKVYKESINL